MAKFNSVFQIRLSSNLLNYCRSKKGNVAGYIRKLIKADIEKSGDKIDVPYEPDYIPEVKRSTTPYIFYAKLDRVVDGDTFVLDVDLGFNIRANIRVRLDDVNVPELDTKEGRAVLQFVKEKLTGANLVIETKKQGRYGRYLAKIFYHPKHIHFEQILTHGKLLNQELIENGLAVEYK